MHFDCTKILKMDEIEIEGRKIVSKRDPPGQKSVYIRPGICFAMKKIAKNLLKSLQKIHAMLFKKYADN